MLEVDKKIIGFAMMTQTGYIQFLYIDSNEHNKGYSNQLLLHLESQAKELQLSSIFLHASEYVSKHLIYEKLGFVNKGQEAYQIAGIEFIGNKMEKILIIV